MAYPLPYLVQPLPDEILGSWLARLRALNEYGAWLPTIEMAGYDRHIPTNLFDHAHRGSQLEALLLSLGFSWQTALNSLTTLPFWYAFGLRDKSTLDDVSNNSQESYRGLAPRRPAIPRSSRVYPSPRYCPQCAVADLHECGAPYWHRAHQLPTVLVCPQHEIPLRAICETCRTIVAPWKSTLVLPLTMRCRSCGDFLTSRSNTKLPRTILKPYVDLAKFSFNAMRHASAGLHPTHAQVRAAFAASVHRPLSEVGMRYGELLMKTFGLSHVGVRTFAGLGPQQSLGLPENLALASTPALAGAPEIAAFFCALGRNYSEAQNVFQDYAAELQPTVSAINYGKPEDGRWTVSSARTALRTTPLR